MTEASRKTQCRLYLLVPFLDYLPSLCNYLYFRQGLTKDKCRVHFDGRKAVITFARGDVNNTTILSSLDFNMNSFASGLPDNMDILHDVYVAMKLKSLPKEDLKLKVNWFFTTSTYVLSASNGLHT